MRWTSLVPPTAVSPNSFGTESGVGDVSSASALEVGEAEVLLVEAVLDTEADEVPSWLILLQRYEETQLYSGPIRESNGAQA